MPSCLKDKTITVTGIGRMSIPNDVIKLGFTIETKDMEAQNSFNKNNKISSRVNDLLLNEKMIPEKNITTINYQIFTKYLSVYSETNRTSTDIFQGYLVSNQIEVKLSDKLTAISLIDSLVRTGVNKINYINFTVEPETMRKTRKQLEAMAVKDAFDRAENTAKNANLKVTGIQSISLQEVKSQTRSSYYTETAAAPVLAAPSETKAIYTGSQETSINANIVFLVKEL
jgi:uncharacterized protein YggE